MRTCSCIQPCTSICTSAHMSGRGWYLKAGNGEMVGSRFNRFGGPVNLISGKSPETCILWDNTVSIKRRVEHANHHD